MESNSTLSDGADWWLVLSSRTEFADGTHGREMHCKVLQWERLTDNHGQPALTAWLNARHPIRADRLEQHREAEGLSRGPYVRLTAEDIETLRQAGTWHTIEL